MEGMIRADRLAALRAAEVETFRQRHPRSAALAADAAPHWLYGLPMHWLRDWPLPHPLFVERAQGAELVCADGHRLADFCLGDTGAMYGHAPPAVARALIGKKKGASVEVVTPKGARSFEIADVRWA